jgi:hypothetical protein
MASKWISIMATCALAACSTWAWAQQTEPPSSVKTSPDKAQASDQKDKAKDKSAEKLLPIGLAQFAPPEQSLADASFEQSAGGSNLSALALATPDADWAKKWAGSGKPIPKLRQARLVALGEKVQVVVFVASRPDAPTLDAANHALLYAVDIYRPDGSFQERMADNTCMKKGDKMEGGSLAVCEGVLTFELEPSDPKGQWVFKFTLAAPGQDPLVFGTSFEAF